MLIISCHADTGFECHSLSHKDDCYHGHLDNFAGVYGVMKAYFSGRITNDHTCIELTYGEETDMEGAREVAGGLTDQDVVLIVDVTGTPTSNDLVIEKCKDPAMQAFVSEALDGLRYDLYADCPDPVSCCDETDVYSQVTPYCCFVGIPCEGGDYNEGQVWCRKQSIDALAEAICRLSEYYPEFCRKNGMHVGQ
jgi:hypothetical protein